MTRKTGSKQINIEFIVGLFFLTGLAILGVFTIILNQGKSGVTFVDVDFEDIGKVQVGDKVLFRGYEIGSVKSATVTEDKQHIRLRLDLQEEQTFYENYLVEIRSTSILGGTYIYIESGSNDKPQIANGAVLKGNAQTDIMNKAADVLENLDLAIDDVREFTTNLKRDDSTIGKLVTSDELYKEAQSALVSVRDAGKKIGDAADEVAGLKTDATKTLKEIQDASKSVSEAGKSIKQSSDNFNAAITDARNGKGTLGKLLKEEQIYDDLLSAVKDIKTFSANLNDKNSSLGKIMNDKGEFYQSLNTASIEFASAMKEVNQIAKKVNKGDGTVARLLNDDDLYKDAKQTLKDVQSAINDIREAAPIASFGSFIFSAL